jgi:phage terminase small subunit
VRQVVRGLRPDPAPLKLLRGGEKAPKASKSAKNAPEPPEILRDQGRAKWLEMFCGVATAAQTQTRLELVTIYCLAYEAKCQAIEALRPPETPPEGGETGEFGAVVRCGTGGLKPHPALRVMRDQDSTMLRVLTELIRLDAVSPGDEEVDPLDEMISGTR